MPDATHYLMFLEMSGMGGRYAEEPGLLIVQDVALLLVQDVPWLAQADINSFVHCRLA